MPLFDWRGVNLQTVLAVEQFVHGAGPAARRRVGMQMLHEGIQPDEEAEGRLARTRWLEANRAERTFPCGLVPEPAPTEGVPQPRLNVLPSAGPVQVLAAVLPSDLAFLLEEDTDEVVELGRLPREAIREVDVVDVEGNHVPEPIRESIDPAPLVFAVLRWSNAGAPDEDRFAFRSSWLAWQAARRLLEARRG